MESDIYDWVSKLSEPRSEFNDLPACPYAKKALMENKVKIIQVDGKQGVASALENITIDWPLNIEVVVIGCKPENISADELTEITEVANKTFLAERGYLALEDHPDVTEEVAGYIVNCGGWALILLQAKEKIITARSFLERRGYYKNWDKSYYEEVVLNRS